MKSLFLAMSLFLASLLGLHTQATIAPVVTTAAVANSQPSAPQALAVTSTALPSSTDAASVSIASNSSPNVTQPTTPAADYVTEAELTDQINDLRSLISSIAASTTTALTDPQIAADGNGVYYGEVSAPVTQLSNITVSNVFGLTASEIPALNYFPASSTIAIEYGGTGTSTRPTANKLLLSDASGNWEYVSTSSLGISGGGGGTFSAIGPAGQTQNGPVVTLATSTTILNGLTSALTTTASGNTITFAPSLSGTLTVSGGGTGSTTLSGLLKGNGTGSLLSAVAGIDYQAPLTFAYPLSNTSNVVSVAFGTTTANVWSQLQTFASGLLSQATSTIGNGTQTGGLTISGGATTTQNAYFAANVGVGARILLSPTTGITDSQISSSLFPGIIRANSANPFAVAPTPSTPIGEASNLDGFQIQQGAWSSGIATLTLRTGQTNNYVAGSYVTISSVPGYNGTYQLTAATSNTVSYALANNPGTVNVSYGQVNLEPELQITPTSPFGSALIASANANCVPDGNDVGDPIIGATGGDGGIQNYGWYVGCDGHSVSIYEGGVLKDFENGGIEAFTSDHTLGWANSPTAIPDNSSNIDTEIARSAAGVLEINNGTVGQSASTRLIVGNLSIGTSTLPSGGVATFIGNVGIGTTSPGSILSVGNVANFTTATSTFYGVGGINISSGCFAIAGTCLSTGGGGGGSGTVDSGTQGQVPFFNSSGTTLTATSSIFVTQSGNIGIGTTSPATTLSVSGSGYLTAGLGVGLLNTSAGTIQSSGNILGGGTLAITGTSGTSTVASGQGFTIGGSQFVIQQGSGNVGIGTANPSSALQVNSMTSGSRGEIYNTTFNGTGGGTLYGINNTITSTLSSSGGTVVGNQDEVNVSNSTDPTGITALQDFVENLGGAGSLSAATGVSSGAVVYNTGSHIGSVYDFSASDAYLGNGTSQPYGSVNIEYGYYVNSLSAGSTNYGLYFNNTPNGGSIASAASTNISIMPGTGGNIGIGTTNPYSRLQITGPNSASSTSAFAVVSSASTTVFSVFDGGNAQLSGTLTQSSDQRLKTNIQSLDASGTLALIAELNPVTFNWINPEQGNGTQVGFIAQQVQQLFPELVSTTSATALTPNGTLGLNYIGLISPIVSAIQSLYADVQTLEQTVANFAQSITSAVGNFGQVNTNELCVGSTCVTPAQFLTMVQAANQSPSTPQQGQTATSSSPESVTQNSASTTPSTVPPTVTINGDNPAIIQVGATYADLGATVIDTGTGQADETNLGYTTFLNDTLVSNIVLDTSEVATDTIDYVATDSAGLTATSTRTVIVEVATAATSTVQ